MQMLINMVKWRHFGRKREMLTATMANAESSDLTSDNKSCDNKSHEAKQQTTYSTFGHTVVIGAGVSGLLTAWSLANRGITVTLLDKSAPLTGGLVIAHGVYLIIRVDIKLRYHKTV